MLIEQIDDIGSQTLQRFVGDLPDVSRAAIHSPALIRLLEAELGGDNHRFAEGLDGFTDTLPASASLISAVQTGGPTFTLTQPQPGTTGAK